MQIAKATQPLAIMKEVVSHRHEYAREWKDRTGGKVLGYFCTYVPEELAYAAGILPVRILGSHEPQDVTEPYLYSMYCPFCRDCLAQGLLGKYDYVDGVAMARTCVHIYQAFDSWQRHLPVSYSYFLSMPARLTIPGAHPFLVEELKRFKASLQTWTGKQTTAEDLGKAIDVYNTNRRLLTKVYELRKADNPPVSGSEVMEMVLASMLMDKAEHNRLLVEFLARTPASSPNNAPAAGVRIMIIGMEDDDVEVLRLVEKTGASVVTDEHCTGTRYFWKEIAFPSTSTGGGDFPDSLLGAIASRYLEKPPCPQKDVVERRRLDHMLRLALEYRVQGALLIHQKFCDAHQWDIPAIVKLLKEHNIPTLSLEMDVTTPHGQISTRLEAFVEMLQMEA
ncbi:MAG: 2-hydroxyacyl-CoA dehydratase [Chloroflexi bacterium]|nr:2-hydroxyacyl-CoA dehydratase [Chloroflexota bacterium]